MRPPPPCAELRGEPEGLKCSIGALSAAGSALRRGDRRSAQERKQGAGRRDFALRGVPAWPDSASQPGNRAEKWANPSRLGSRERGLGAWSMPQWPAYPRLRASASLQVSPEDLWVHAARRPWGLRSFLASYLKAAGPAGQTASRDLPSGVRCPEGPSASPNPASEADCRGAQPWRSEAPPGDGAPLSPKVERRPRHMRGERGP